MNANLVVLAVCGALLMVLGGCCCAAEDFGGGGYGTYGGYGQDYYGGDYGSAESDLFASEAGMYEGSEGVGSTSYVGQEDGTYVYEDYDPGTGGYEYTYQ